MFPLHVFLPHQKDHSLPEEIAEVIYQFRDFEKLG
jgi:hypothetical protein